MGCGGCGCGGCGGCGCGGCGGDPLAVACWVLEQVVKIEDECDCFV